MKKILVIRFSSIGDIVLTSPVVRCLKQQLPGCEIHFLTKSGYQEIISTNPYIDKCFFLENSLSETMVALKKENYDLIIDLHHNLRTALVKFQLGKKSYSFPKLNYKKWLMVNLRINKLPPIHIVDRYFQTVNPIGVKNDGKGLDYFIPSASKINLSQFDLQANTYIAYAMGGKFNTKKLPLPKMMELCKKIKRPILLLGGKEDFIAGEQIVSACSNNIMNTCGKLTLNESASVLEQSLFVLTHDTGLMHIAAALKKEIVSVWGSTIPEFGMSPYYGITKVPHYMSEVHHLDCRPCSKLGFEHCPKKHFRCMVDQDENRIADYLNQQL